VILGMEGTSVHRFQPSEGVYLYLLGLVIIATHPPDRLWLGFTLAAAPIAIGPLGRAFGGRTWRDVQPAEAASAR
jgi:hypothetical protein